MKITSKDYANALFEICQNSPRKISDIAKNFYLYLLKKRKIKLLPFILDKLAEIEKEKRGIKEIEIETARPLSEEQKRKLMKIYKKQKVIIQEKINPQILGGIILKIDDIIIDGSIKGNLERLKEEL